MFADDVGDYCLDVCFGVAEYELVIDIDDDVGGFGGGCSIE
jgi:hypothetical protein